VTFAFEFHLDSVTLNQRAEISRSTVIYFTSYCANTQSHTDTDTRPTDSSTWTTKVVGNNKPESLNSNLIEQ